MSLLVIAELIVNIIGYTMVLYGIWLLIGRYVILDAIYYIQQDIKRKRYVRRLNRITKTTGSTLEKDQVHSAFSEHISMLLLSLNQNSILKNKINTDPINFYILSLFIFIVTSISIFLMINDFFISLAVAVLIMLIPYTFLRIWLARKRAKTSLAFMKNFHIIIQSYNTSSKSAYHTVKNITEDLDNKELKKIFIKLLASMQQDRNPNDFRQAILIFSYSINSSFAIRFGNLLTRAYLSAADITLPLNDLNKDIMARKNDLASEKSLNVETKILGYLPIITLPGFIYGAWRVSTMYDFWKLFKQNTSFVVFLIALVLTAISTLSVIIFLRPRSDV